MSNLIKKIERSQILEKRKETEKDLSEKIGMFGKLPDKCDACSTFFDKKSREMANTWVVVVKYEESVVRLFCPLCLDKAKEILPNETERS